MAKKKIHITHPDLDHEVEEFHTGPESKTETAGYRTVTQQLAALQRAGLVNRLTRSLGAYDVESEVDEEIYMSGGYHDVAYDNASAAEALRKVAERRAEVRERLLAQETERKEKLDAEARERQLPETETEQAFPERPHSETQSEAQ